MDVPNSSFNKYMRFYCWCLYACTWWPEGGDRATGAEIRTTKKRNLILQQTLYVDVDVYGRTLNRLTVPHRQRQPVVVNLP